jgi:hypothetical protein
MSQNERLQRKRLNSVEENKQFHLKKRWGDMLFCCGIMEYNTL